jgi:heme exporter protein CcmD
MSHVGFIIAAYAITGVAIIGVIATLVLDHRTLAKALERFPSRDVDRESP